MEDLSLHLNKLWIKVFNLKTHLPSSYDSTHTPKLMSFSSFASFQFRTDIARTEYLSNADERLRWQASSLPADDLCTENAIMLKRFNRSVRGGGMFHG